MAIKKTTTSSTPGLSFDSIVAAQGGTATNPQTGAVTTAPMPTRYTGKVIPESPAMPVPAPTPTTYNDSPVASRPSLDSVDENAIREQTRQRMQSSIDAINANYANLIAQEKVQGENRAGQTRAINARSGLMGSDFGMAQQEKTTRYNAQQQQQLVDAQNAQIQGVLDKIEERAMQEIQMRKNEALGKYERDLDVYKETRESARMDLKLLAESGMDLGSLNPAQKAALFKQSGYDDEFGELIYNAMKPKPKQIDYKFEKLADGRGMFYGVDPETGELKRIDVSIDLPPDWQVQIAPDGTVLGFDKNTGEARVLSEQGQFAKPEDPTEQALKQAQIDKIRFDIANGNGSDVLSPNEAKTLGVPYGTTKGDAAKLGIIPTAPLSAEAQKLQSNVKSGIRALETVKKELFGDPNKNLNEPGDIRSNIIFRAGVGMAREYASATRELKDILVRLRTGAAISKEEEDYYNQQLPYLYDNESTVRSKLRRFEELFNDLVPQRLGSMSAPEDLFNEFENAGNFKSVGNTSASNQLKAWQQKAEYLQPISNFNDYAKKIGNGTIVKGSPYHHGLEADIDGKIGDPIRAFSGGKVIEVIDQGKKAYGKKVVIQDAQGNQYIYGHLNGFNVKPGQTIPAGFVIGTMGNTGNVVAVNGGDGSHLHIEKRDRNGKLIHLS